MAKGQSLHIGLNYVDPNHYNGWNGELNAAEYDANDMNLIASLQGFVTTKLLREEANRDNILSSIEQASKDLVSGDIFFITYSGHGGQVPDQNGDEDDGLDETWCLFDGELIDDELYSCWNQFASDVRILIISDSCHSGSVTKFRNDLRKEDHKMYKPRFMPPEVAASTYFKNKAFYDDILSKVELVNPLQIPASVKLLSACQDNQESMDGDFNGRFTGILKSAWNGGKFRGSYYQFYKQILNRFIPYPEQSPNYSNIGKQNMAFDNQTPFMI